MTHNIIITIDGPVGVGKSTVARELAQRLGFFHLDTGAMYRAVTLMAMRKGIDLADESALAKVAAEVKLELSYRNGELYVYCNEEDVTQAIRSPEVSRNTSPVSDVIAVRQIMVEQQRAFAKKYERLIAEGRDIGTVVFPTARWKFYLDAALQERAKRRLLQLQQTSLGFNLTIEEVLQSIIERDQRDRSRSYGPLRVATDAIIIDTTSISQQEVVNIITELVRGDIQ
ncbi:MAG: (d)CMP kinase [Candidatus Sumerlaeia bacterium]|nr:(d)CMP kinase [Candidatus Sumerlaeia bacterium]